MKTPLIILAIVSIWACFVAGMQVRLKHLRREEAITLPQPAEVEEAEPEYDDPNPLCLPHRLLP